MTQNKNPRIDFRKQISSPILLKAIFALSQSHNISPQKAAYLLMEAGANSFINKKTVSFLLTVETNCEPVIKQV